jgi:lysozyme
MAGLFSDDDADSLAYWAGVAIFGYMVVSYIRNQAATDSGGAVFQNTAPNLPWVGEGVDIFSPMQISPDGADFIRREESLTLVAKPDGARMVIGYGHDIQPGENIPNRITTAQAETILANDLNLVANDINAVLKVSVTQDQFDALGSLVLNIGNNAWRNSTVLRRLNAGDYAGAAQAFALFNEIAGQYSVSLANRRAREMQLFQA